MKGCVWFMKYRLHFWCYGKECSVSEWLSFNAKWTFYHLYHAGKDEEDIFAVKWQNCIFSNIYWIVVKTSKSRRVSLVEQELLTLRVAYLFSFLCYVFVLILFDLCIVCPMLPVSLDCLFLIVPSVFSSVYLYKNNEI